MDNEHALLASYLSRRAPFVHPVTGSHDSKTCFHMKSFETTAHSLAIAHHQLVLLKQALYMTAAVISMAVTCTFWLFYPCAVHAFG